MFDRRVLFPVIFFKLSSAERAIVWPEDRELVLVQDLVILYALDKRLGAHEVAVDEEEVDARILLRQFGDFVSYRGVPPDSKELQLRKLAIAVYAIR